jgi:hypothetical protein
MKKINDIKNFVSARGSKTKNRPQNFEKIF